MKLSFYQDPGHGWVKVSLKLINKLGINDKISSYSYVRKDNAYLEEDCDFGILADALEANKITYTLIDKVSRTRSSKIRSYDRYIPSELYQCAKNFNLNIKASTINPGITMFILDPKGGN